MSDRIPLSVRVDEDVQDNFREFTYNRKGKTKGEMGRLVEKAMREYMDRDRYTRLTEEHEEIYDLLNSLLAHLNTSSTQTHTNYSKELDRFNSQIKEGISATLESLPEGVVEANDIKQAVYAAGRTDSRTVDKYRDILTSCGFLLPHPLEPHNSSEWVHGAKIFVHICESNDRISPEQVDELVVRLERQDRFSTADYQTIIGDEYPEDYDSKIVEVDDHASTDLAGE